MSKILTSPIPRWTGTVTLHDPFTVSMAYEIEKYLSVFKEAEAQETKDSYKGLRDYLNKVGRIPVIQACVEKWELEGFVAEPFPVSPRDDVYKLIDWLYQEISFIYFGELQIPNE